MWFLEFATRLLGRTPKHTVGFIRSMALPIMLIVMVLALIEGLAGETEIISESVGVTTRLIVLEEGKTDLGISKINESITNVLNHPKIDQILPQRFARVSVRFAEFTSSAVLLGVNQTAFLGFFSQITIEAETGPPKDNESYALIGSQLAQKMVGLKSNLPASVFVRKENQIEQFNITVGTIIGGKGLHQEYLIIPSSKFVTLFPENSDKISFVELKLKDTRDVDDTIEALKQQANLKGYNIQIIAEQSQDQISDHILNEIVTLFWAFGIFAFFIVSIQAYFAVKWITVHYRTEFATLRCLGTSKRILGGILVFDAMLLGNIALLLAIFIGILSATALLAIVTTFTQTTRIYAAIDLPELLIVVLLTNLASVLGSIKQIREIGRRELLRELGSAIYI